MDDKVFLTIRMDRELHDKFKSIAAYEGRSMSRQVLYILNQHIQGFEKAHGPIDFID